MTYKALLVFSLFLVYNFKCAAQQSELSAINLAGNIKTKRQIITRELPFSVGSKLHLSDSTELKRTAAKRLYNTKLFSHVEIWFSQNQFQEHEVNIIVTEKWYTFILPFFQFVDRGFNDWWYNQNGQLDRIIYGFNFSQNNTSGRDDDLKISVLNGFQQKFEVEYDIKNQGKDKEWGYATRFQVFRFREVNYGIADDKLQFLRSDEALLNYFSSEISIYNRLHNQSQQGVRARIFTEVLGREALKKNPNYFTNGLDRQSWLSLSYFIFNDKRDVIGYARKGYRAEAQFQLNLDMRGFNSTFAELRGKIIKHQPLNKLLSIAHVSSIKISTLNAQPYRLRRGLGWGNDYLRGYELYAINAENFFLQKTSLRFFAVDQLLTMPWMPVRQLKKAQLKLVPKIFFDAGMAQQNLYSTGDLGNKALWSFGTGIDIALFDDAVWRFEISKNSINQLGFYVNFVSAIQ